MLSRTVVRYSLDGVGMILALVGLSAISGSGWFLTVGLFVLFLGITDFGRQCPLILSARHLAHRIRSGGRHPSLSVEPLKEVSNEGHEKKLPLS